MHGFLQSAVAACLAADRPMLTEGLVKALNFHSMARPAAGRGRVPDVPGDGRRLPAARSLSACRGWCAT